MSDKGNLVGNPLEQFILLAKSAKGAAAVELVKQALEVDAQMDSWTLFKILELLDRVRMQKFLA